MSKSDKKYWDDTLDRYRASKTIRSLRRSYGLLEIGNLTGHTRQYIYGIQEMTIKPNSEFIKKLNEIYWGLNSFKLDKESFKNLIEIRRF